MSILWDEYLMSMAYFVAMRSKDRSTHIGAVVVDKHHRILATGYNSFVSGIDDNIEERQDRPEKYLWFEHAERNCCYSAAATGVSLNGSTMYTPGLPCMDCARAIVQSGIKKVVIHSGWDEEQTRMISEESFPKEDVENMWTNHAKRSFQMFKESGVEVEIYYGDLIKEITTLQRGQRI